jgi:1,4-dihydroxy-2-naphthoate octaprenyltransferase
MSKKPEMLPSLRNSLILLRIPFSFFLSPLFFFALLCLPEASTERAIQVFIILHLLVYPASNGYNSFMDRDKGSIGGLEKPPPPDKSLFYLTLFLDGAALGWSYFLGLTFCLMLLGYILASRAYSWRGIRIKQYPVSGFLTVFFFQGGWTILMIQAGLCPELPLSYMPWQASLSASCLIGALYPLTQVYQHEQDERDGVRTISMLLGIRGSFIFTALLFLLANGLLFQLLYSLGMPELYLRFMACNLPVLAFFLGWASMVWKNPAKANYRFAMRMNMISSVFMNISFLSMLA